MADRIKYEQTGDGINDKGVHFVHWSQLDYTLCGLTLDGDSETCGAYHDTEEKVDCYACISTVKYAKSIKAAEYKQGQPKT